MTISESSSPSETRSEDRSMPMLVAAVMLVVAAAVAVFLFGGDRRLPLVGGEPPPVESLEADPMFTPPSAIAWTTGSRDEPPCLYVGDPSGEVRRIACDPDYVRIFGWTDDGILMFEGGPEEESVVAIDPGTGERTPMRLEEDPDLAPDITLVTNREQGRLQVTIITLRERITVWEVEAPDTYDVREAALAPDGTAVAMIDTAGRLLVAPADGSRAPRQWSEQVEDHTDLTWEGAQPTPSGT
jgi:hypothetical protein